MVVENGHADVIVTVRDTRRSFFFLEKRFICF